MEQPSSRPNTAVVVIDVQNDVVAAAHDRDAIVANINSVVQKARAANAPVVWIQHNDDELPAETDGWKIVPELIPKSHEVIVHKQFRDSFEQTTLEDELARIDAGRLVITGAQTDYCVRWTLHGAQARGYDTVLVGDGHTTDAEAPQGMPAGAEIIAHTNAIWASQATRDGGGTVVTADDLSF